MGFSIWTLFIYIFPSYWMGLRDVRNGGEERRRLVDSMSSAVAEESFGNNFLEGMLTPHMFDAVRNRLAQSYKHPDDIRTVHLTTFNRKHKLKEHYMTEVGNASSMTTFR